MVRVSQLSKQNADEVLRQGDKRAWTLPNFTPMGDIPTSVKLTSYSGEAGDITQENLQAFVDDVAAGRRQLDLGRTFGLGDIAEAHRYMERDQASGKLVVVTNPRT